MVIESKSRIIIIKLLSKLRHFFKFFVKTNNILIVRTMRSIKVGIETYLEISNSVSESPGEILSVLHTRECDK